MPETQPYTIPRPVLSRLTGFYYLRTFWPILVGPTLFGLVLLIFGPNQGVRFFGLVLAIWPGTTFVRALLITNRPARAWAKPTTMAYDEEALYFESQTTPVSRLRLKRSIVRRITKMLGFYVFQFGRFDFVAVPAAAFASDEERQGFETTFAIGAKG